MNIKTSGGMANGTMSTRTQPDIADMSKRPGSKASIKGSVSVRSSAMSVKNYSDNCAKDIKSTVKC